MKLAFSKFIFQNKKKKKERVKERGNPPNQSRIIKLPLMNMVIPFSLFIKKGKQQNSCKPMCLQVSLSCLAISHVQLLAALWSVATKLLCPWDCSGKNLDVGCHFLLQGIFLIQGSNLCLLHYRQILNHLNQGNLWLFSYHDYLQHSQPETEMKM